MSDGGRTLLPQRHRDVRVCVANTTEKNPVDNSRWCLGTAVPVRVARKEEETSVSDLIESTPVVDDKQSFSEIIGPTLHKLPSDITDQHRHQIVEFLQEYDDMFSRGTFDMGRTTLVEHSIDTINNFRHSLKTFLFSQMIHTAH